MYTLNVIFAIACLNAKSFLFILCRFHKKEVPEHYFRQWCQDIPREQDNLY